MNTEVPVAKKSTPEPTVEEGEGVSALKEGEDESVSNEGEEGADSNENSSDASPSNTVIVKLESEPRVIKREETPSSSSEERSTISTTPQPQQQIYIIQTADGSFQIDGTEVVVADDMAVYETASALEQLSRGCVVGTTVDGQELMLYEEVVLPDEGSGSIVDQFVDVQEVEVGDGRSASPVKIETGRARPQITNVSGNDNAIFIPLSTGNGNTPAVFGELTDLHCSECGKLFKSKRSLFGHKKEKHSGVTEVHHCPECGKSFGRKSNLKAHRESLHYGKKFPCAYCERIFTNRSSMNQHIKKTHSMADVGQQFVLQQ